MLSSVLPCIVLLKPCDHVIKFYPPQLNKMARCIEIDLVRNELRRIIPLIYHLGCTVRDHDLTEETRTLFCEGLVARLRNSELIEVHCVRRSVGDWSIEVRNCVGCKYHPTPTKLEPSEPVLDTMGTDNLMSNVDEQSDTTDILHPTLQQLSPLVKIKRSWM